MFGTATKKEQTKAEAVTRVHDYPDVREAADRLVKVQLERIETEGKIADALRGISRLRDAHGQPTDPLTLAAERVLAGEDEAQNGPEIESLRKILVPLRSRVEVLKRAEEIQKSRVSEAESRAARDLWATTGRAAFEEVSRELVLAVAAAGAAVERWRIAQGKAEAAGLSWNILGDVPPHRIQKLRLAGEGASKETVLYPSNLGDAGLAVAWGVSAGVIDHAEAGKLLGKPLHKS